MFPSQMVRLKIVEPSSGALCPCFPRKCYALKLSNTQVAHFLHFSLANGASENCGTLKWPTLSLFPSQMMRLKIVKPSSSPLCPCFPRKWYELKIVEPSSGPLFPCFPCKWYALKLSKSQVAHFFHVSLAMVCLKIVEPSSGTFFQCFPRKWYALKLSNPQVYHFLHISLANGTS